jgi:tape measure domain-containing protein
MTMDVSRLGIAVESTGIDAASKALQGLGKSAATAEQRVSKLTDSMERLSKVNSSAFASAWNSSLAGMNTAMAQMAQSALASARAMQQLVNGLNQMAVASGNAQRAQSSHNASSGVFTNTLKAMAAAATAYLSINFVASIVKQADEWQNLEARMSVATGSMNNSKVALDQMIEVSNKLHQPLDATVNLYARLAPAMRRAGKSSDETKNMVEGVASALKLSGASAEESASVMLQFSQSINQGYMQGQEFNAVVKGAPLIIDAMAKSLGVSRAELIKLRGEGKLTTAVMQKAIEEALPEWQKNVAKLPMTFQGAMIALKNEWTRSLGEMADDTQFNQQLGQGLGIITAMIPDLVHGMGDAFKAIFGWVSANKVMLLEIWDQVKGIGSDVWGVVKGIAEWVSRVATLDGNFNAIGFALFAVRLAIAGIQDGFTLVTAIVAKLASYIVSNIGGMLIWIATQPLKSIIDGFQTIIDLAARAAGALGMTDTANALQSASMAAENFSTMLGDMQKNTAELGDSLSSTADAYFATLTNGQGAVAKLLSGEQAITAEKKKQKGIMDSSWGNGPKDKQGVDPKAAEAAKREQKHYEDALVALKAMLDQQNELNRRLNEFGLDYDKIGPAQKKVIELNEQLIRLQHDGANATIIKHQQMLIAVAEQAAGEEQINSILKARLTDQDAALKKVQEQAVAIGAAADKAEAKLAAYGQAKGASDAETLSRMQQDLASAQAASSYTIPGASPADVKNAQDLVVALQDAVNAQERLTTANTAIGQKETYDQFEHLLDPAKASNFGEALADGFGKAGQALGKLTNAVDKYGDRTSKVKKAWEDVNRQTNPALRTKMTEEANQLQLESTVTSYADMAGAAKEFFGEHTKGYAMMEGMEKGFRLWQMAMQLQAFMQQMGFLTTVTTATLAADTTKTTSAVVSGETQMGVNEAVGMTAAAAGVANQAMGDPYSAIPRMAAMAAIMAAIGFAVSGIGGGGGGSDVSKDRQASQGTGTVLGDATKQSESIANSIDLLSQNSNIALRYSSGMLASLKNIETSLKGVTNSILLNPGTITGSDYQGGYSGGFMTGLLGTGTSHDLVDSGITSQGQTVGSVLNNGYQGSSYQDTKSTGHFLGFSTGSSFNHSEQGLDPAMEQQFTQVITGMTDTLTQAGEALGMTGEQVTQVLNGVDVSLGNLSLKGLSADEIEAQLEAVFSSIGDKMTTAVLGPAVTKFQQAGEGLLQTAVRVAGGVEQADFELSKLGLTAIDFSDIVNTSGDVGAEIVRQTVELKEAGTGIGDIMQTMQGSAADLASTYSSLLKARLGLEQLGIASDVSHDLLMAAGGLDSLQSALDSYKQNFFSDSEQQAMDSKALSDQFAALGLVMPATKEGFRALVDSLVATGPAGEQLATQVLLLSDAFSSLDDAVQANIDQARSDLTDAYNREASALEDTQSKFLDFSKSLTDFKNSLVTGDLSTLSAYDKYQELKAQYTDVETRAMAGDQDAIAQFQGISEQFLQASRDVNASGQAYTDDYNTVAQETADLAKYTEDQSNLAASQLDLLQQQVSSLITINDSVLTVTEAIAALTALMATGTGGSDNLDGSHAGGLANVPYDGYVAELHKGERVLTAQENKAYQASSLDLSQYGRKTDDALVNEIKALREEVKNLRTGQREQTGAIVAATYDSNERNAQTIVDGHHDVAKTTSYQERAKVTLA